MLPLFFLPCITFVKRDKTMCNYVQQEGGHFQKLWCHLLVSGWYCRQNPAEVEVKSLDFHYPEGQTRPASPALTVAWGLGATAPKT